MSRARDWDKAARKDQANRARSEAFDAPTVLKSKYKSTCPICKQAITPGEQVYYRKGAGVWHVLCPA